MPSGLFLGDAAARLRASVVAIVNGGHGAGFAWRGDLFVTSAHVVSSRKAVVVTPDGRAVEGTVVGRDVDRDIALLRAPEARVPAVTCGGAVAPRARAAPVAGGAPPGVEGARSGGGVPAGGGG